jgi:hypothetical protein
MASPLLTTSVLCMEVRVEGGWVPTPHPPPPPPPPHSWPPGVQRTRTRWKAFSLSTYPGVFIPEDHTSGGRGPRAQVFRCCPGFLCATKPSVAQEDGWHPFWRMFHPECPQEKEVCGTALALLNCSYRQPLPPPPPVPPSPTPPPPVIHMCCVSLVHSEWITATQVSIPNPQELIDLGHSQSFSGSNWWPLSPTEEIMEFF